MAQAWKTIARVNAAALKPGDSVGLKRGDLWSGTQLAPQHSGTSSQNIVFDAYGTGAAPVITVSSAQTVAIGASYLAFNNLDVRNTSLGYSAFYFSGAVSGTAIKNCSIASLGDGITSGAALTGLTIDGIAVNGYHNYLIHVSGSGSSNITISNITAGPSTSTSRIIEVDNSQNLTLSNIRLTGNGSAGPAYLLYLSNVSGNVNITNISLASGGLTNLYLDRCPGLLAVNGLTSSSSGNTSVYDNSNHASGSVLSNATISDSGDDGFRCDGCSSLDIKNVVSQSGTNFGFHFVGEWNTLIAESSRAVGNKDDGWSFDEIGHGFVGTALTAQGNLGDGFSLESGSTAHDVECDYCKAFDNGDITNTSNGDGFTAHDNTYNFVLKYCVAANNKQSGLAFVGYSQGFAYNCTLYNNGGQWSQTGGLDSVRGNIYFSIAGYNPITGTSWTVENTASQAGWPTEVRIANPKWLVMDYNLYYHPANSNFAFVDSTAVTWQTYQVGYGLEPHSIYGNPLFTNPNAGDFTLQTGSPGIGAGLYIPGVSTSNPPNIGAY